MAVPKVKTLNDDEIAEVLSIANDRVSFPPEWRKAVVDAKELDDILQKPHTFESLLADDLTKPIASIVLRLFHFVETRNRDGDPITVSTACVPGLELQAGTQGTQQNYTPATVETAEVVVEQMYTTIINDADEARQRPNIVSTILTQLQQNFPAMIMKAIYERFIIHARTISPCTDYSKFLGSLSCSIDPAMTLQAIIRSVLDGLQSMDSPIKPTFLWCLFPDPFVSNASMIMGDQLVPVPTRDARMFKTKVPEMTVRYFPYIVSEDTARPATTVFLQHVMPEPFTVSDFNKEFIIDPVRIIASLDDTKEGPLFFNALSAQLGNPTTWDAFITALKRRKTPTSTLDKLDQMNKEYVSAGGDGATAADFSMNKVLSMVCGGAPLFSFQIMATRHVLSCPVYVGIRNPLCHVRHQHPRADAAASALSGKQACAAGVGIGVGTVPRTTQMVPDVFMQPDPKSPAKNVQSVHSAKKNDPSYDSAEHCNIVFEEVRKGTNANFHYIREIHTGEMAYYSGAYTLVIRFDPSGTQRKPVTNYNTGSIVFSYFLEMLRDAHKFSATEGTDRTLLKVPMPLSIRYATSDDFALSPNGGAPLARHYNPYPEVAPFPNKPFRYPA